MEPLNQALARHEVAGDPPPDASRGGLMKRIGLLGGMSWESTALYYRLLNEGVAARLGGLHSADCVVVSIDFAAMAELQAAGQWDEAGRLLAGYGQQLEAAGAEMMLVCSNTMHKVVDQIEAAVDIPLLHIADTTAAAARRAGLTRVGLLATAFTMEQSFMRDQLAAHGLEVIVPDADGRALVHRVIYDELCRGIIDDASRRQVSAVIDDLVDDGAEGVILGCTEIELLIGQDDSSVPLLPTTLIHANAALELALDPVSPQPQDPREPIC